MRLSRSRSVACGPRYLLGVLLVSVRAKIVKNCPDTEDLTMMMQRFVELARNRLWVLLILITATGSACA